MRADRPDTLLDATQLELGYRFTAVSAVTVAPGWDVHRPVDPLAGSTLLVRPPFSFRHQITTGQGDSPKSSSILRMASSNSALRS